MIKKILVGTLIATIIAGAYIFPTTINVTEYGLQIEFFNGNGYFIEY